MKKSVASIVLLLAVATLAHGQHKDVTKTTIREVKPVASVDLNRYEGKWYEIARFPNWFQKQCESDVTAEYRQRKDGKIDVSNRCRKNDGTMEEIIGIGRVVDTTSNAKLKISFSPDWMSWLPMVWGDYWIIALAPDYSYAVVGVPGRKYLWILSRTPSLPQEAYEEGVRQAAEQGFEVKVLVKTKHSQ